MKYKPLRKKNAVQPVLARKEKRSEEEPGLHKCLIDKMNRRWFASDRYRQEQDNLKRKRKGA